MFHFMKGHLASYFGPELQKYTSFKVHHEEIRHVTVNDIGILSLSSNELCFSARTGLRIFNLRLGHAVDLTGHSVQGMFSCNFHQTLLPFNLRFW